MRKISSPDVGTQKGIMLLEALIAILVFSVGVLTVVALQAASVRQTSDALYRTNATLLANRLLGQMWTSSGTINDLQTNFQSPAGVSYLSWVNDVNSTSSGLPGAVALPPVVTVTPVAAISGISGTAADVSITLSWRTPEMQAGVSPHSFVATSQIVKY